MLRRASQLQTVEQLWLEMGCAASLNLKPSRDLKEMRAAVSDS